MRAPMLLLALAILAGTGCETPPTVDPVDDLVSASGPDDGGDDPGDDPGGDPADDPGDDPGDDPPPGSLALRGDPAFDPASLTADEALWVDRLDAAVDGSWSTATARAGSDDLYWLGRYVSDYVASLLLALRATGDLRYLDTVAELTEIARGDLADAWLDGTEDGYLNWRWRADETLDGLYGTDDHPMDEAMTHGMVGLVAHAFDVNRDLDPAYAEMADFWLGYLENHFLAKWASREGSLDAAWTSGFYKRLTHPRANQLRLAHYLHAITGDAAYGSRASGIAAELAAHLEPNPDHPGAVRWKHQVAGSDLGWQKSNYAQYVVRVLVEMNLEGRTELDDATLESVAVTFRDVVYTDTPDHREMANDVNGDGTRGASGYGNVGLARWDGTSEALLEVADATYSDGSSGVSVAAYALMAVSDR